MNGRAVYFAACLGPFGQPLGAYKIGVSYDHTSRVKSVSAGLPFTLSLAASVPGGRFMETLCHLYLKKHRIRGEYFLANTETDEFVTRAAEFGRAFHYISDDGTDPFFKDDTKRVRDAFLAFHGVSLEEVAKLLQRQMSAFATSARTVESMAAAALIAQRRPDAHFVSWPNDAMCGLLGQRHYAVAPLALPEPSAALEAA